MYRRSLVLTVSLILLTVAPLSVEGQSTNWASVVSIRDITGNTLLQSGAPLIAGHSYNLTLNVDVPFTQSSSHFQVTLDQGMTISGSQFWYVLTPDYGGYSPGTFVAGSQSVDFAQVQGRLTLAALFTVPSDFTLTNSGITLHFAKPAFPIIGVGVTGGSQVGSITEDISDQVIQNYQTMYASKSSSISSGTIDPAYSQAVNQILAEAKSLFTAGLVEQATDVLGLITTSNFPPPPSAPLSTPLLAGTAVLGVLMVIFLLMFLRARGRASFVGAIKAEVQKDLAALEVTAAQYDKALADRLKRLRDKLGEGA